VTDALVALGLIDPRNFLGGRIVLDGESAVAALGRLGRSLGLDPEATARGVHRLAREQMTLAVKGLLVERGLDPRRFAFVCYGGCGPLFGAPIARALGIRRVVVPALAAVFSAFGAAASEVRREVVRTLFRPLPVSAAELTACFAALEGELTTDGMVVSREVDVRFRGQSWEVTVPLARLDAATIAAISDDFRARYAALYGRGALAHAAGIDLVNCRVIVTGAAPSAPPAPRLGPPDAEPARRGARNAWLPDTAAATRIPVYDGERLAPGMTLPGPALVERRDTSILVPAGDGARIEAFGDMVIEVAHA
jgi:N-methylhydantoinase A